MDINLYEIDFRLLLAHANLNKQSAAHYLDVSIRTIERWIKKGAPKIAIRALEFRAGIAPGWERFKFHNENCISPVGHTLSNHQIEQFQYLMNLEREIGIAEGQKRQLKSISRKVVIMDEWRKWNDRIPHNPRKKRN